MAEHYEAVQVLDDLWEMIETQQWDKLPDLLDLAVRVRYMD